MSDDLATGYFAQKRSGGPTHIVRYEQGAPTVCGVRPAGAFIWCADGARIEYVRCESCREWYRANGKPRKDKPSWRQRRF